MRAEVLHENLRNFVFLCNTLAVCGIVLGVRVKRSAMATPMPVPHAPAGLNDLFDAEYEVMYRLAFAMLGSDRDAEEVVQDAFLAVAGRWDSVDNPGGYLRVIVVNGARKQMRTRIRRTRAETKLRTTTSEEPDTDTYLLDVLDGLPDRQRVAVVLTYYSGLNSSEVGELLDRPQPLRRSPEHVDHEQRAGLGGRIHFLVPTLTPRGQGTADRI
jgi:RNA polymerase sigma factor (sigma-70 family)